MRPVLNHAWADFAWVVALSVPLLFGREPASALEGSVSRYVHALNTTLSLFAVVPATQPLAAMATANADDLADILAAADVPTDISAYMIQEGWNSTTSSEVVSSPEEFNDIWAELLPLHSLTLPESATQISVESGSTI